MIYALVSILAFAATGYTAPLSMTYESSNPAYLGEVKVTLNQRQVTAISMYRPLDAATIQFAVSKETCAVSATKIACALLEEGSGDQVPFGLFVFSSAAADKQALFVHDPISMDNPIAYSRKAFGTIAVPMSEAAAEPIQVFVGQFQGSGKCLDSIKKLRLYVSVTPDQQLMILKIYGDDARRIEIPLGKGSRPAPGSMNSNAIERFETAIVGSHLESHTDFFVGPKKTGSGFKKLSLSGKTLTLSTGSTFIPRTTTCQFERSKSN